MTCLKLDLFGLQPVSPYRLFRLQDTRALGVWQHSYPRMTIETYMAAAEDVGGLQDPTI